MSLRIIYIVFVVLLIPLIVSGQHFDTLMNKKDSLENYFQKKADRSYSDSSSVSKTRQEIDSIKVSFESKIRELQLKTSNPIQRQQKKDSLQRLYSGAISEKLTNLKNKGAFLSHDEKNFLKNSGVPDYEFRIPSFNDKGLPSTSLPSGNISEPRINLNILDKPSVPQLSIPEQIVDSKKSIIGIAQWSKQAGSAAAEIKSLKSDSVRAQKLDELAEQNMNRIKDVGELKKELSAADKLKQLQQLELKKIANAQYLRDQASSKLVTDKILGKEEMVNKQIEKMSKYQKKFDHLHDIRFVPKIKPNSMKGKPLKERLAPGVLFQILKGNNEMNWFFAPEVLYKFSGTFSGGVAGMYRLQHTLSPKVNWNDPVYGFKLIAQAKTYKQFYVRVEWENTSMLVYDMKNAYEQVRSWNRNWLIGIGREQRISSMINGYFWAFYNFSKDDHDLIQNKVIIKSGLQFKLVNNQKKVRQHIINKLNTSNSDGPLK